MKPISTEIKNLPAGFLIPVAILIAISFPPLFGHELIALLCGVVYGLWIGFAIVALGTFLGESELAIFQKSRGKADHQSWNLVCIQIRIQKEGCQTRKNQSHLWLTRTCYSRWRVPGTFSPYSFCHKNIYSSNRLQVVLIIRFSIIPAHFSTAVFSTCNVKFWYFAIAVFLTLPKQIILVYLGVLFVQESKDNTVNYVVLGLTFLTTVVAGAYIYTQMRRARKILLDEQAARLDAKRDLPNAFRPHANLEVAERSFRQYSVSISGNAGGPPPTPTWQEGGYEMDDIGRQRMRTQDFI